MLDNRIKLNDRFEQWLQFYQTSKALQDHCVIGDGKPTDITNDPLFLKHDYFWSGDTQFQDVSRCIFDKMYDANGMPPEMTDAMYMMYIHRLSGSGASYQPLTHGKTNTPLMHFRKIEIDEMIWDIQQLHSHKTPMFSSAACQIPMFPKIEDGQYRCDPYPQGVTYMIDHAPEIVRGLYHWLEEQPEAVGHMDVVNWMADYHKQRGWKCFWFQFHLFSVDLSDWYPHLVKPESHTHWGSGATKGLQATFHKEGRIANHLAIKNVSEYTTSILGHPMKWNESMACLFYKYINM